MQAQKCIHVCETKVAIQHAHLVALLGNRNRKIYRDVRLANSTLATRDREDARRHPEPLGRIASPTACGHHA